MTIVTSVCRVDYAGDGVSTVFPISFPFWGSSELQVVLFGADQSISFLLSVNGYSISGGNGATGALTLMAPLSVGARLIIVRQTNRTQLADFVANDDLPSDILERALDRLAATTAEILEMQGRTVSAPIEDGPMLPLPSAAARAGLYFGFDTLGNPTAKTLQVSLTQFHNGVSIADFGAIPDGGGLTPDNTAAIQTALDSGAPNILIPFGNYRYRTLNVPAGVRVTGLTNYSSLLMTTTLAGNAITLNTSARLETIYLTAVAQRTSGAMVSCVGNRTLVRDFQMDNYYIGISIAGANVSTIIVANEVSEGLMRGSYAGSAGGGAIDVENYSNALIENMVITGPGSGTQPDDGIRLRNGDTCLLARNNITTHGRALLIQPGAGENTFATIASDCLFDSSDNGACCEINPLAGGYVHDTQISNSWFGLSSTSHGLFISGALGTVDGVELTGCQFPGNTGGCGARVDTAANVHFTGGHATGNGQVGLYATNANGLIIMGFRSGPVSGRGGNGLNGINIGGATNNYIVQGCNTQGNGSTGLVDAGSGSTKSVTGNI